MRLAQSTYYLIESIHLLEIQTFSTKMLLETIIFILIRLEGFIILLIGWSSNSTFSLMASIRFIAQSISYEARFMLIIFCLIILRER